MAAIKSGDYVAWKWAGGIGHGTVQSVHTERTVIESKGKRIVRNGTNENPAVLITDHNGVPVLKLGSELQPAE